jgi:hypothetical protein
MSGDDRPNLDDWGGKLDAGTTDEPTLALAERLRQEKALAKRPAPAFRRQLRERLVAEAEKGPKTPVERWAGALAGAALLILVGAFAVSWLSQPDEQESLARPLAITREAVEKTPTAPVRPDDLTLIDQPAPDAPDYLRLIAISPAPNTMLVGEQVFTVELGYRLESATGAIAQAVLGDLPRETSAGDRAPFLPLAASARLPAASEEQQVSLTGTFRAPEEAWLGPGALTLLLSLRDADTGAELFQATFAGAAWSFDPRVGDGVFPTTPRYLWVDDCDPRQDPTFCNISESLAILEPFYAVVADLNGTLTYALPTTVDELLDYDVVIANFCGSAGTVVPLLEAYYQRGGSLVVMGDTFCVGVPGPEAIGYSSAAVASLLTDSRGIFIQDVEEDNEAPIAPVRTHPATAGVETLYAPRSNGLRVFPPAQALATRGETPFLALEDGVGTLLVIPRIGFHWMAPDMPNNDNLQFWRSALRWLGAVRQVKEAAGGQPVAAPTAGPSPTPDLNRPPQIIVSSQTLVATNRVFVEEVFAPTGGWLALHLGDSEGPVLTQVAVGWGLTQGIPFDLPAVTLPAELTAVLHEDAGESAVFEFPGPDVPVVRNGVPVTATFLVSRITPTPWHTPTPATPPGDGPTPTPWYTPTSADPPGDGPTLTPWLTPTPEQGTEALSTPTPWYTPTPGG